MFMSGVKELANESCIVLNNLPTKTNMKQGKSCKGLSKDSALIGKKHRIEKH